MPMLRMLSFLGYWDDAAYPGEQASKPRRRPHASENSHWKQRFCDCICQSNLYHKLVLPIRILPSVHDNILHPSPLGRFQSLLCSKSKPPLPPKVPFKASYTLSDRTPVILHHVIQRHKIRIVEQAEKRKERYDGSDLVQ